MWRSEVSDGSSTLGGELIGRNVFGNISKCFKAAKTHIIDKPHMKSTNT